MIYRYAVTTMPRTRQAFKIRSTIFTDAPIQEANSASVSGMVVPLTPGRTTVEVDQRPHRLVDFAAVTRRPAVDAGFSHLQHVVGEALKQLSWMDRWRRPLENHDGAEVNLVIERDDGAVIEIEVKPDTRIANKDLAGRRVIRDALGDVLAAVSPCIRGIVLHPDDRIFVLPIDRCGPTL